VHDIQEVKKALAEGFRAAGFKGRRTMFQKAGDGLVWLCHVDRSPFGEQLYIDVGISFDPTNVPRLASDCDVSSRIESLVPWFVTRPGTPEEFDLDASDVYRALDMSSTLYWEQRLGYLEATIDAFAYYVDSRLSLDAVRVAFRSGEFTQYVSKSARSLLG
jgi:hypothetical protein